MARHSTVGLLLVTCTLAATIAAAQPPRRPSGPPAPPVPQVDFEVLIAKVVRVAELERRRFDAEAELADALRRMGPAHPDVKAIQQRLAIIESGLREELGDTDRLLGEEADIERRRSAAERQLRDLRQSRGPKHPDVLAKEAEIAGIDERLRKVAAAKLGAGREQELLATLADTPGHLAPYFELARLYVAAGRLADAERVVSDVLTRLKQSGGR